MLGLPAGPLPPWEPLPPVEPPWELPFEPPPVEPPFEPELFVMVSSVRFLILYEDREFMGSSSSLLVVKERCAVWKQVIVRILGRNQRVG